MVRVAIHAQLTMSSAVMVCERVKNSRSLGDGVLCGTASIATRMPTVAAVRYILCFVVVVSFNRRPDTMTLMGIDMQARTAIVDVRMKIRATESVMDASVAIMIPVHHSKFMSTGGFACAFF